MRNIFAFIMLGLMLLLVAPAQAAFNTGQTVTGLIITPPGDCITIATPSAPDVISLAYERTHVLITVGYNSYITDTPEYVQPLTQTKVVQSTMPSGITKNCIYISKSVDAPARNAVIPNLHDLLSFNYGTTGYKATPIFINYRGNSY